MTTKTIDPAAVAKQKLQPPHIVATFCGTYYRSVGAGKGKEHVPFEKSVKVPYSVIAGQLPPVAFFRRYKEKKLMTSLGGAGIRECFLREVDGDLPKHLPLEVEMNWIPDHGKLIEIANNTGTKTYIKHDRMLDKKTQETVTLRPELYPSPEQLRFAIKLLLQDAEAFALHQERVEKQDALVPKSMEADILALSDDDDF